MIFDYGFSLVGKSHLTNGTCCQDNHKIKRLSNGWVIAASADGVGSAKNSQIGSKIATETVVSFCDEYMPWDYSVIGIKSMLRTAYNYAFKSVLKEAEKTGEPIESYDTTLNIVIFDGHRIIYGHSGDGAIIGLNTFGQFVTLTTPQKGADGITVLPLRSGYTQWVIDSYDEDLVSVLIMTDGMLDILSPYLLRLAEPPLTNVYTPLASFFGDPIGFEADGEKIKNSIFDFLKAEDGYDSEAFYSRLNYVYSKRVGDKANELVDSIKLNNWPVVLMQGVQDDKTLVCLINTDNQVDNNDIDYYREPDWIKLQERWNRKAYPHLYSDSSDSGETIAEDKSINNESYHVESVDTQENVVNETETIAVSFPSQSGFDGDTKTNDNYNDAFDSTLPLGNDDISMKKHKKPKKRGFFGL